MTAALTSSIEEAAAVIGVDPGTLRGLHRKRRLPHTKIGRHVRLTDQHIAQIIESGQRQRAPDSK